MADPKVNFVQPKPGAAGGRRRSEEEVVVKPKVPLWLILVIVIQGAVMAGGFVWYKHHLALKEEERLQAEKEAEEKKKIEAMTFQYPLEAFSTNISSETSDLKVMQVSITFEVLGQVIQDEMNSRIFEVRDEINNVLSSKSEKDVSSPEKLRTLQQEIKHRMDKLLEKGEVQKVYFTDLVITERVQ